MPQDIDSTKSPIPTGLPGHHQRALEWFLENTGATVPWTPELTDGTRLFSTPKGIYKPAGADYALSIRQTLGARYPDREITFREDGTWSFVYHQEGDQALERDNYFTNRGLMKCLERGTPIGVAKQISLKPDTRYHILGLAKVIDWQDGFFYLEGFAPSGALHTTLSDGAASKTLRNIKSAAALENEFDPLSEKDAREKSLSLIVKRRGQAAFRASLLRLYGGECVVSGCSVEAALEAAHVTPYLGPATNTPQNGLLLRADLHTLWDLGLWAIHETTGQVLVASPLEGTDYQWLGTCIPRLPTDSAVRPSIAALQAHREYAGL